MCQHLNRVGDNYGESCRDCGKQLSGYGYGGWFGTNLTTGREKCIHSGEDVCIYCETPLPVREQKYQTFREFARKWIVENVPSDAICGDALQERVWELVNVLNNQGHSGTSFNATVGLLNALIKAWKEH